MATIKLYNVGIDQLYLPSENIKSQSHMDNICNWTDQKLMQLNEKKSKVMIFNFTQKYQFATRIKLNDTLLETISDTRLLGTIISSDLKWHANTQNITARGYQRMVILRNLYDFDIPREDLVLIYTMYIRSVLEFNSNVWFSSITVEERENIERVQRVACKIILKDEYTTYSEALEKLNLTNLSDRRQKLAKKFAQKCVQNDRFKDMFPLNTNNGGLRHGEQYVVNFASTDRLQKSSIPAMQKILNRNS